MICGRPGAVVYPRSRLTAAALVILALGIGLSSAVFSLVNALLFRPAVLDLDDDRRASTMISCTLP
jgi:hypothetical protein